MGISYRDGHARNDSNEIPYATMEQALSLIDIELVYGERVYVNPDFLNQIDAATSASRYELAAYRYEMPALVSGDDFVPAPFSMNLH